jgi:hypothetical protein
MARMAARLLVTVDARPSLARSGSALETHKMFGSMKMVCWRRSMRMSLGIASAET